ncbi:MAG TPA: Dna2/Cas4 domain-containing protein [Candidatus Parcubacteria bacterium]|nr:Dna2/Cas4 domain-containing protein [Candidatus Parcubacteria bacterium]
MLKEIIDKFYLDREKDKEQTHFYVTDAGRCPRSLFFKFKNAPRKETEPNILRLFDHGDYIHKLIMRSLLGSREIHVVASEINIPPQELISGRADAIISDGKDLYVLDIKSINSVGFKYLKEPKKENVNQIQLYLYYFKVPKGILLYVNKDTQELKEFIVSYDESLAKLLLNDLDKVKKYIDNDVVPGRIPGYPSDWQCRFCPFKDLCIIGGNDKISWQELKDRAKIEEDSRKEID